MARTTRKNVLVHSLHLSLAREGLIFHSSSESIWPPSCPSSCLFHPPLASFPRVLPLSYEIGQNIHHARGGDFEMQKNLIAFIKRGLHVRSRLINRPFCPRMHPLTTPERIAGRPVSKRR